ncbi:Hsp20/alpha crystallin family protein [Phaeodactylibacter luteus]|uniref:Hsp20/alpha crystallin family protein n=1 Tax=Phaeodactylibacter luteus TaxID=1564516 RepID=A0A5C6RJG3_9BACT|nr:Hsp20/alpha crystallin family protein [Phaeodactylibacter luteus]TXB62461.1 Hsp20/alpha crystallin family protein [Phaeodactylibacter luteus]
MIRAPIKNHAFERMGERFARVIDPDHFLGRNAFDVKSAPPVNIVKDGKLFEMEIAVPGFAKDELEVFVDHGILTVKGEKRAAKTERSGKMVLEEFNFDAFERKFKLSDTIAREQITARYDKGILFLTFVDVPEEQESEIQRVAVD